MRAKNTFIKSENLNLISLTKEHIYKTNWYDWFNDEQTCKYLSKHYYPNNAEKQEIFLNSITKDDDKILLGIDFKNKLVGVCSIYNINFYNRNSEISIVIGEKVDHRFLSIEVIYCLLVHCFFTLNLNKVKMGQHKSLFPFYSILSETFGFKKEGVLKKEFYKNGKYVDILMSALFKNDFINNISKSDFSFIKKTYLNKIK